MTDNSPAKYWFIRINPHHMHKRYSGSVRIIPINMIVYTISSIMLLVFLVSVFGAVGIWPQAPKLTSTIIALCGFGFFIYSLIFKTNYSLIEDTSLYPKNAKRMLRKEFR